MFDIVRTNNSEYFSNFCHGSGSAVLIDGHGTQKGCYQIFAVGMLVDLGLVPCQPHGRAPRLRASLDPSTSPFP